MTAQLDPWELNAPDEVEVFDTDAETWDLGAACDLGDTECEACQ